MMGKIQQIYSYSTTKGNSFSVSLPRFLQSLSS